VTKKKQSIERVGLWAPNGGGNLGNEITLAAVIQNLRHLKPDILLYGITWVPHDTESRHGITTYPIKRISDAARTRDAAGYGTARTSGKASLKERLAKHRWLYKSLKTPLNLQREVGFIIRTYQRLKKIDLLVFAGTGILQDSWGGVSSYPYRIFLWSLLSRLAKVKVAVVSVGAGPIDSAMGKRLIRYALNSATYRSFRNENSKKLIEGLGVDARNRICPDLAFSLEHPLINSAARHANGTEVVIAGLPYRKPGVWTNPSEAKYEHYLDSLAIFASWLLQNDYVVRLLPTQIKMDAVFIEELYDRIISYGSPTPKHSVIVEAVESFDQLMSQLAKARIVITSRYHGVIFSYLLGKPVIGIAPHRKVTDVMASFGQEEFCIDADEVSAELLRAKFKSLEAKGLRFADKAEKQLQAYKLDLNQQYENLLQL